MKYAGIINLLETWEQYESDSECVDIQSFARWILKNKIGYSPEKQKGPSEFPRIEGGYENVSIQVLINIMIHRLARQWEWKTKSFFSESEQITSLSELRILSCVAGKNHPKKSEVIGEVMLEITTGTILIQKLAARGLLKEIPDTEDKRVIRLEITLPGRVAVAAMGTAIGPVMHTFFSVLTEEEKQQLATLLVRLDG